MSANRMRKPIWTIPYFRNHRSFNFPVLYLPRMTNNEDSIEYTVLLTHTTNEQPESLGNRISSFWRLEEIKHSNSPSGPLKTKNLNILTS